MGVTSRALYQTPVTEEKQIHETSLHDQKKGIGPYAYLNRAVKWVGRGTAFVAPGRRTRRARDHTVAEIETLKNIYRFRFASQ